MKPVKFASLLQPIAVQCGLPALVVQPVLALFWQELRLHLTTLAHPRIQVLNLGTFALKPGHIEQRLKRRQQFRDKQPACLTARQQAIRDVVNTEIHQLERARDLIYQEKFRKARHREQRQTISYDNNTGEDLAKEEPDC